MSAKEKELPLPEEDVLLLVKEAADGNKSALEYLIAVHFRFIIRIAKKFERSGVELSDLIAAGKLGLEKAIFSYYDNIRDIKFIAYAVLSIRHFIMQKINGTIFTDPRDGKTYRTVQIGEQVWMTQNLNYEAEGSVCYENDPAKGEKYGMLYDWNTAMKACPSGWHLPSDEEWQILFYFTVGKDITGNGKKLKAESGWNENKEVNSGNGTDDFGFSALPGGYGSSNGNFINVGNCGYWWSASEYDANYAYSRSMGFNSEYTYWNYSEKSRLLSVRCVMD
jgi:uncharacterized protein (TIGR02145 family)